MNHLLNLGTSAPIRIPCLCSDEKKMYDGGDFAQYPAQQGWDVRELQDDPLQGRTASEAAAFLQAWAYFGLLSTVFQPVSATFNLFDFVERDTDDSRWVTTKKLGAYVLEWQRWEAKRTAEERKQRFTVIKTCLDMLLSTVTRLCRVGWAQHRSAPEQWPLPPDVGLSILVLGDTITWAGYQATGHKFNLDWGYSPVLQRDLRDAGWCPRAIQTLLKGQQLQLLYSASTLGAPLVRQDHQRCSDKLCRWEQIDERTYRTQHRSDCDQQCQWMRPVDNEYFPILRAKDTPLLHLTEVDGVERLVVSSSAEISEYVAISHVWGDGLGNPSENALPRCQARFLQALVNRLQGVQEGHHRTCHWWMDTICVPVGEDNRNLRKEVIRNMRRTYQDASRVLALDSSLMAVSSDSPVVELYIRLKLSSWMRRLWTLQEAILAKYVYIQFSDDTRTIRDIASSLTRELSEKKQNLYTRYGQLAGTFFGPFVQGLAPEINQKLTGMWRQLQWRATSHAADETLCLAVGLDLDPGPLLEIPPERHEQRMVRLLQEIRKLPLLVLYQPPPRLDRAGFRWAPTSFLNTFRATDTNPFRVIDGTGETAPDLEGLMTRRHGFVFHNDDPSRPLQLPIGGDVVICMSGHPNIRFRAFYWFQDDRRATNIDGSSVLKRPAIVVLVAQPAAGEPTMLVEILDGSPPGKLKVAFIAAMMLGQVRHAVTEAEMYKVKLTSPEQEWNVV